MEARGGRRAFSRSVTDVSGPDTTSYWRKGWDSNPRYPCRHAGFQDRCLKPLGHPSGTECQSLIAADVRRQCEVAAIRPKRSSTQEGLKARGRISALAVQIASSSWLP